MKYEMPYPSEKVYWVNVEQVCHIFAAVRALGAFNCVHRKMFASLMLAQHNS